MAAEARSATLGDVLSPVLNTWVHTDKYKFFLRIAPCHPLASELRSCAAVSRDFKQAVAAFRSQCHSVDLEGDFAIDASITFLARRCPNLKSLSVDSQDGATVGSCAGVCTPGHHTCGRMPDGWAPKRMITDASMRVVAQAWPGLTTLELRVCEKVTFAGFLAVARGCPALKTLYISERGERNARNRHNDADPIIPSIFTMLACCRQLTSLGLDNCDLTDATVSAIGAVPGLKELRLCSNYDLSDGGFRGQCWPALEKLDVDWTSFCGQLPPTTFPNLRELVVCACDRLDEAAFSNLITGMPLLATINASGGGSEVGGVGDTLALALAESCSLLRECDMTDSRITDAGVAHLMRLPLETLNVSADGPGRYATEDLTEAAIDAIAQGGKALKELTLGDCRGISDDALIRMVKQCPALVEVSINWEFFWDSSMRGYKGPWPANKGQRPKGW